MDDYADPLLGIEHHNDSYAVEAWRSSYTVEVWKGSYVMEAWTIVLIHFWVSSTIMSLRTRQEKFLHCGSVERVLYCGSMDDCADLLLGIEHHIDTNAVKVWRSSTPWNVERFLYCGSMDHCTDPLLGIEHRNDTNAVKAWRSSYTVEVWKGSYIVEALTIVLSHCLVSITITTLRTRKEKFLHRKSVEKVLYCGSMEDCADLLLGIEHHNDSYVVEAWRSSYTMEVWKGSNIVEAWTIVLIHFLVSITIMTPRTREEKFLHIGSVEKVLYFGSMDDCADPLLGIEHHNDSYIVEGLRNSYTREVWKGSYTVESSTIVLIRCWVSSTFIIPMP
nr:hypothetical protein CFP56_19863 [Quercus suber]